MTRTRIVRWTGPVILLLTLALWYQLLLPAPLAISARVGEGEVFFVANRQAVLLGDDCVVVRWLVEQIAAVFYNDEPQIGTGRVEACALADAAPTLRVQFRDGRIEVYRLEITILSRDALTWALIGVWGGVIALYGAALAGGWRGRLARVGVLSAVVIGVAIIGWPLTHIIAADNWLEASFALVRILGAMGAGLLALLIVIGTRDEGQDEFSPYNLRLWIGVALGALLLAAAIIIHVNPRGMYFSDRYETHQLLLREFKLAAYTDLPAPPDVVVLGSSRAFTIDPEYIGETLGLSAFNLATEGARTEDIFILVRMMRDRMAGALPPVLLIEVQEGLPRQPNDIASRAPFEWLPYLRPQTAALLFQRRLAGLVDVYHLAEALYITRYDALYTRRPAEWPYFSPQTGFAERPLLSEGELANAVEINLGTISPLRCAGIDPISRAEIDALIALADETRTALVFYLSPWIPRYYDAARRDDPEYQRCYAEFLTYMADLTAAHEHVSFLDYSRIEAIDGVTGPPGFYDSDHLAPENSRRLIDAAGVTLRAAYELALARRAGS